MRDEHGAHPDDPPFMLELAHCAWLELALYILDIAVDLDDVDTRGDLLARLPVLSPLVHNVTYRYPVHELDANDPPTAPPETPTHRLSSPAAMERQRNSGQVQRPVGRVFS